MDMKIVMPKVTDKPTQDDLKVGVPTLVRHSHTGDIRTVIRCYEELMFFSDTGVISYATGGADGWDKEWFDSCYEIIREYTRGDLLTISV